MNKMIKNMMLVLSLGFVTQASPMNPMKWFFGSSTTKNSDNIIDQKKGEFFDDTDNLQENVGFLDSNEDLDKLLIMLQNEKKSKKNCFDGVEKTIESMQERLEVAEKEYKKFLKEARKFTEKNNRLRKKNEKEQDQDEQLEIKVNEIKISNLFRMFGERDEAIKTLRKIIALLNKK